MPELRKDPITDRWVVFSEERSKDRQIFRNKTRNNTRTQILPILLRQ